MSRENFNELEVELLTLEAKEWAVRENLRKAGVSSKNIALFFVVRGVLVATSAVALVLTGLPKGAGIMTLVVAGNAIALHIYAEVRYWLRSISAIEYHNWLRFRICLTKQEIHRRTRAQSSDGSSALKSAHGSLRAVPKAG